MYVMNVGLDMRLVNTNTLEVADVISYQKQIIGRQISAGVFSFLGTNFFDVSVGESALEPIQLAVRSVIERAVLEMITRIYRAPGGSCAIPLGTSADPLREAGEAPYAPPPAPVAYAAPAAPYRQPYAPQPYPAQPYAPRPGAYAPSAYIDGRNSPYRNYGTPDPVGDVRLRGEL
jgi:curli production assembly/transport component CsgG/holdfast attachment protein HfaB